MCNNNSKLYCNFDFISKNSLKIVRMSVLFSISIIVLFQLFYFDEFMNKDSLVYAQSNSKDNTSQPTQSILATLVDKAVQALETQNTTKSLLNLNLVIQALKEANSDSSYVQTTKVLLEDAVTAINDNDTDRASVYMGLAIDELSVGDRNTESSTTQTPSIDGKPIASENFLPYENSIFGIKIKYPDNWSVRTYPYDLTLNNTVVGFYSPSKTASELGNISGVSGLFVPYLDVFVFSSKNNTLERIIDEKIKRIQNSTFFSISQSEPSTLKGNQSAYTLIYSTTVGKEELFKKIQVYTIFGDKVYLITFTSQDALFSDYLPVAKKMIDSFQVKKS